MAIYLDQVTAQTINIHNAKSYRIETIEVDGHNCVCTRLIVETEEDTVEIKMFIDHKYLPEGTNNVS